MPGCDATGPQGRGPMSGGGRGFCARGAGAEDYGIGRGGFAPGAGRGGARGAGRGGGGWGYRNQYYATGLHGWQRARRGAPTEDERLDILRARERVLADELENVRASLATAQADDER
jgi:Family of unknown function (DUF5320)